MSYPDLLILRHGETEWNVAGRLQGAADSPLTALGRAQARAQGRILARFGINAWACRSSPQGRALATADLALGRHAARLHPDPRLAEIAMGDWTGLARADIARLAPDLFSNGGMGWYDHAPGGEGLAALYARCGAVLGDLDGPAVLVTHGITSRMLRCHALGLGPDAFADLPGGQGVVYHLSQGAQHCLSEGA